ncbi:MAG: hypothetical protein NZ899_10985 [Thermoguttaceae bacterium]|nr:hypothetical protein [Thermoguttaceae bacterium]MDW8079151.1 hypothetical protein [Thermoguttaceae bacterium]
MVARDLPGLGPRSSWSLAILVWLGLVTSVHSVEIASPGLPPSRLDEQGRLVEDWGTVSIEVLGSDGPPGRIQVQEVKLEGCVPAGKASGIWGELAVSWTVYRAPIFPAGVDVLTIALSSQSAQEKSVRIRVNMPEGVKAGLFGAQLGGRQVVSLLPESLSALSKRDWGYVNETTPMPGWAKPERPADPAFANIRAGMGGIPILYRFKVEPRSQALVVLGICESHYSQAGIRPVLYEVEGARPEVVDPIARWGRHKPGALVFRARDVNGDGELELAARPLPAAPDRNPILNVVWVFPADRPVSLPKLIAGELSGDATYYVDVGGKQDQCFFELGPLEFPLQLPPGGTKELTLLVACANASAPSPAETVWTKESLLRAAREVWLAWR